VIVQKRALTPELAFTLFYLLKELDNSLSSVPTMIKVPFYSWEGLKGFVNFMNLEENQNDKFIEKRAGEKSEVVG
jgi:hypothetical protein